MGEPDDRADLIRLAQAFQASGDHLRSLAPDRSDGPASQDLRTAYLLRLAAMRFAEPPRDRAVLVEEMLRVGHENRLHYQDPRRAFELLIEAASALAALANPLPLKTEER